MELKDLTHVENFNYSGEKIFAAADDFLPINGTDYVELYAIAAGNSTINTGGTAVCYFQGYLVRAA